MSCSVKTMENGKSRGRTLERFAKENVMNTMWEKSVDFTNGCPKKYWVDSSLHLPIFARMFAVNVIWYDVDAMKTYFAICSNDNDDVCVTVQMKDGYHSPDKMEFNSFWSQTVVLVYYDSHYQYLSEHNAFK